MDENNTPVEETPEVETATEGAEPTEETPAE